MPAASTKTKKPQGKHAQRKPAQAQHKPAPAPYRPTTPPAPREPVYEEEVKREVVRHVVLGGKTIGHLAELLEVHRNSVSKWVAKYRDDVVRAKVAPDDAKLRQYLELGAKARAQVRALAPRPLVRPVAPPVYTLPDTVERPQQDARVALADTLEAQGFCLPPVGGDAGKLVGSLLDDLRAQVRIFVNEQVNAILAGNGGPLNRKLANRLAADIMAQASPTASFALYRRMIDLSAMYDMGKLDADSIKEMTDLAHKILTRSLGQPKLPLEAMHTEDVARKDLAHLSDDQVLHLLSTATPEGLPTIEIEGTRAPTSPAQASTLDVEPGA